MSPYDIISLAAQSATALIFILSMTIVLGDALIGTDG